MKPRDYQREAIDQVKHLLAGNPCLVAPTGSGKSFMGAVLADELQLPTLWLAHRKELVEQAAQHLRDLGVYTGIIKSGIAPDPLAPVQVASVQTLTRRNKPRAGLIIIDEAHHATAAGYASIVAHYPGVPIVGLTATPFRLDGRGLGDLFGELVIAAWPDELCDRGILHRPKVYAVSSPDMSGVKIIAGDYHSRAAAERTNTTQANTDIVREWQQHAAGKRTVAFAINVEHSMAIAEAFQAAGVPAEHLDGGTDRQERENILRRLRTGQTHIVSNCMVLTEGWDLPALECAIIARPTASLNLHLQMIGRIMRACEGKDGAIVLDHAGNHHRHGLVTRRLDYTLDGTKKIGSSEPLGLRRCRGCGLYFETTKFACPECGWQPTAEETKRELPALTGMGKLSKFDDSSHEYRAAYWLALTEDIDYMGPGWASKRYKKRFGEWPLLGADNELVNAANATIEDKRSVFTRLSDLAKRNGYKPGWASWKFKESFGHWPRGFVQDVRGRAIAERFAKKLSQHDTGGARSPAQY